MSDRALVYHFNRAIVRPPGKSVAQALRAGAGDDPSYDGVASEHAAYVAALGDVGIEVLTLPVLEAFPDSIFIEDPALVFPEGAIALRPGAESRAGEVAEIAPALRDHFDLVLDLPGSGFVDGGDILTTQNKVMIGLSARTDKAGADALIKCLEKLGRASEIVDTPPDVLHFKTDCSLLDEATILTTSRLSRSGVFKGFEEIIVPDGEEAAANALRVNDVVFVGADFPQTIEKLQQRGYDVVALKTSEIGKIDAGLSCMSLRWMQGTP